MISKLLLIFVLPISCALANDNASTNMSSRRDASTIRQIVKEQTEAIQRCDGERLYLKAEKIYLTNHGPVLYSDGSAIFLPNLSADQMGYYLACRSRDDYRFTCPDPDCGRQWWFTDTWSDLCPRCGTPGE